MKRLNGLVLSALTAAFLVGCGGSSSGTTSSSTTVPATKGPLLMATAVDSSVPAKTGVQISGTNKYTFTGDITYPIIVSGGYVDVNNNGIVDAGDYQFTGKLSSYSNVVTPITTYLGNPKDASYDTKLKALKTLTNSSTDELTKNDPVETNENVLALVASIYKNYSVLMDTDDSNDEIDDDIENENSTLSSELDGYKLVLTQGSEGETLEQKLVRIEEQLKFDTGVTPLTELDAKKINFSKASLVGKKIALNETQTLIFTETQVLVAQNINSLYTLFFNYEDVSDGIAIIKNPTTEYFYEIEVTADGYSITDNTPESQLGDAILITDAELVDYTKEELNTALADLQPVFTPELLNGKVFYPNSVDNSTEKFEFYVDGAFKAYHTYNSELGSVNEAWGNGNWIITKDGKVNTFFAEGNSSEGTCYQFEITSVDSEKINVKSYMDALCSSASDMNDFTETTQFTSLYFTDLTVSSESSTPPTNTGSLTSDIAGKSIIAYDAYGYVQANFFTDGTYEEIGPDENNVGSVYTCTGKWLDFGNNKIGTTCENNGTNALPTGVAGGVNDEVVYTYTSIAIGFNVTIQDATETFTATIANEANLGDKPFTVGSFVSGKIINVSDSFGSVQATFNTDGTYSETGEDFDPANTWSCSGKWLDFGHNKIATTCVEGGTKIYPDGFLDNNPESGENIVVFKSNVLFFGDKIGIVDNEEIFEVNIDSISNIRVD